MLFLSIYGERGSGKSYLMNKVKRCLEKSGIEVEVLKVSDLIVVKRRIEQLERINYGGMMGALLRVKGKDDPKVRKIKGKTSVFDKKGNKVGKLVPIDIEDLKKG